MADVRFGCAFQLTSDIACGPEKGLESGLRGRSYDEIARFEILAASLRASSMKSWAGEVRRRFFTVTMPRGLRVFGSVNGRHLNDCLSTARWDTISGTIVRNRPVDRSEPRSGRSDVTTARGRSSPSARNASRTTDPNGLS